MLGCADKGFARPPVKSIRSNILAFALLATLLPSIGLGLLSFVGYQEVVQDSVDRELRAIAHEASAELGLWVRERGHDLRTLATSATLVEGLNRAARPPSSPPPAGEPDPSLYLASVRKRLDPILELTLRDTTGRAVASSGKPAATVDWPATWPAAAPSGAVVLVPPRWDDERATPTIALAVPVLSVHNEFLGVLEAVFDLRAVEPRFRSTLRKSPAEIVLLASDGTPLVSTRTAAGALPALPGEALRTLQAGVGAPVEYVDFRQQEVLGVAIAAAVPGLVVAERERAEVFAAWLSHVRTYAILAVALALVVGVLAWWLGRSIVGPLRSLTAAVDRVAAGDLDVAPHDASKDEIGQLTRAFTAMAQRLRQSRREVEEAHAALVAKNDELEVIATTDGLTGLFNRKKLESLLRERFAAWKRDGTPFALTMIEIDNLDVVNADYGLAAGDEVLVTLSAMLRQSVGAGDSVARFGGDRFVILASGAPFDTAMDTAERIRRLVESPGFGGGQRTLLTTVSIGVVQTREGDEDPATVVFRADHALHQAKRAGGNRVQSAM
ncbi:MAG: diguanylate cyclase [Burkholderiales bacterium]